MTGQTCANCGVGHEPDDLFCESCGYDFITGSLPEVGHSDAPVPRSLESPSQTPVAQMTVTVEVSPEFFELAVADESLTLPDPSPPSVELVVHAVEVHIGRASESRGIHPHVDIAALTGDPAVSSRHAVLRAGHAGQISITDLGSTNGTFVGSPDAESIAANEAIDLATDAWIYLGAWTRLRAHIG